MIKISEAKQSPTNAQGRTSGPDFVELIASVKEKGVLVPVLVRKVGKGYEVVAGNRRFAAAREVGLKEIPAQVVEMTDVEAREAQIVENLQRKDIHPLDEGEAYRQLIEKSSPKYTVEDVAAKVGKSEKYVRNRLVLTNLCKKVVASFREGNINDGQAALIAKLDDEKSQKAALEQAERGYTTRRLAEWITEKAYEGMANKPWAKDAKLSEILGDTKKDSLFGQVDEENPVELARKMAAFIEIKVREFEEKGKKLIKLSNDYGTPAKGVVGRDSFKTVGNKNECEHVEQGIVVEGHHMGQILNVCRDKKCETHNATHSPYKQTPKEKAARKKEIEVQKKKKEKEDKEFAEGLKKVKFPLSKNQLDALLSVLLEHGTNTTQPICKRRGIVVEKTKYSSGYEGRDYGAALRKASEKMSDTEKMQLVFEIVFATTYSSDRKAIFKKL